MELIFLDRLFEMSGYRDRRSVEAWLARELRLPLMRIGKNYAVDKALFESRLMARHTLIAEKSQYVPKTETEREFLNEVNSLLSGTTEVPSDR